MAWSTPLTAVSNSTLTAAQWNASVRDNLLMTAPALATTAGSIFAATGTNAIAQRTPTNATNGATGSTTSATYTGTLTSGGTGPAVTVTTGPKALITFHTRQSTSVSGINVWTSVAISGASTIAANDSWAVGSDFTGQLYHGICYLEGGLTAGSNTFTMQYRADSGSTATYSLRRINVVPF